MLFHELNREHAESQSEKDIVERTTSDSRAHDPETAKSHNAREDPFSHQAAGPADTPTPTNASRQEGVQPPSETGPAPIPYSDPPSGTKPSEPFPGYKHLEIRTLPLDRIRAFDKEPRKRFDEQLIRSLAQSIRDRGLMVPLLVTPFQGEYVLLGGNRRLRALKMIGATEARASIATEGFDPHTFDEDQAFLLSLIDNLHRKDLNHIEETAGIARHLQRRLGLQSFEEVSAVIRQAGSSTTVNPLAVRAADILREVGKDPRSFRNNRLQLLSLKQPLFNLVSDDRLDYTKAILLNRVKPDSEREALTDLVIANNLTREEVKRLIEGSSQPQAAAESPQRARLDRSMAQLQKAYKAGKDDLPLERYAEVEKRIKELRRLLKRQKQPPA